MKLNKFDKLLVTWWGIVILFGCWLFISLYYNYRATFFAMVFSFNILLFIFVILLRTKIEEILSSFKVDFDSVTNKYKTTGTQIQYNNERKLAFFLVVLIIILSSYIIFLSVTDAKSFFLFIEEDGLVEYASSIFWFLAAILLTASLIKHITSKKNRNSKYVICIYLMLIILFILCGGEEISWGQRIFHETTPDFLKSVNVQNEITLHNIGSISVFANSFFVFTILFFLYVPYLAKKYVQLNNYLNYYSFPTPNLYVIYIFLITLLVWVFVGIRFGTLGFHPFTVYAKKYYQQMDDEIYECLTAYSFLTYAVMDFAKRKIANLKE